MSASVESNADVGDEQKTAASKRSTAGGKKKSAVAAAGTKKVVEHPSYNEMIRQALVALKERGGSSRQAILKYLMANFRVGSDEHAVNTRLKVALRSGVKSEMLKQSKGSGA
ncbi:hypothetical protein HELRODRAFT_105142, partial [Helobdella robusta]|uniref:H15 domain-containing protein n=1 Tax=Helobdella robusta TaxID=6412 RepID=T1EDR3_HELRO